MNEIFQPHDLLFKTLMSHPETAGGFLQEHLPPELSRLLAPEPPQPVEGTFVEEHLRPYYSDRLFEAKTITGKPVSLYFLIEHKSFEDNRAAWQLFQSMYAFMKQKTRENKKWQKLPAMVPLLLYHGEKEWRFPNEFLALIDADEAITPWLLNFRFPVVDLSVIPNQRLAQESRLYAGFLALKYGTRDPKEQMEVLEELILAMVNAPDLFVSMVLYLLTTFPYLREEHVRQIVSRVKPQEEAEMMSQFAQEILAKNKPEWLSVGRQEGEAKILIRQLQKRFGDLPPWANQKVADADSATLENWSIRLLDAKSLEEVFADPS
ncbi:MAG: Rpn family recombination-promoting nuclease/putative transposase [Magnetococcales bacterium]|nr:Rpn family recombination-promoting nuclease/putative transposase [Magnetococcales bacterium]